MKGVIAEAPTIEELLPAIERLVKEKAIAKRKAYRLAHPERYKQYQRDYRERLKKRKAEALESYEVLFK